jgi:hypothetical protein
MYFCPLPCTSHGPTHLTILIVSISDKEQYYGTPHYSVFSICFLLCSAYVPESSSVPCSQTPPWIYVKIWSDSLHGTVSTLKSTKLAKVSNSPEMLRIITKLPQIFTTICGTQDQLIALFNLHLLVKHSKLF